MKKRILASLLSLCLIVGLLPTAALAADESGTEGESPAVCTCTALCAEGSVDETCPVCAEDDTLCAYTAPAEPAEEPVDEPTGEPTEGPAGEPEGPACARLEGCDGDTHAEECPLYVEPEEAPAEDEIDTNEYYELDEVKDENSLAVPAADAMSGTFGEELGHYDKTLSVASFEELQEVLTCTEYLEKTILVNVTEDIEQPSVITLTGKRTILLQSSGDKTHTIKAADSFNGTSMFSFSENSGSHIICTLENIIIDANHKTRGFVLASGVDGTDQHCLTLGNGSVIQNAYSTEYTAGGVQLTSSNLFINGGTIQNCTSTKHTSGGAVLAWNKYKNKMCSIVMNDGLITGCSGTYGAVVAPWGADIMLRGGTITKNYRYGNTVNFAGGVFFGATTGLSIGGNIEVFDNYGLNKDNQTENNERDIYLNINPVEITLENGFSGKFNLAFTTYNNLYERVSIRTEDKIGVDVLERIGVQAFGTTDSTSVTAYFSDKHVIKFAPENLIVTVTFNANTGDASETAEQQATTGTTAKLHANPFTRKGYTFSGWSTTKDSNEKTYADQADFKFEQSTTLYAQWIELKHDDITMTYGDEISLSEITIDGVALTGWTSADPDVVKIENGKMIATGVGETTITANAALARSGEKLTVNVKVTPMPITFGTGEGENPGGQFAYDFTGKAPEFSTFAKFYPAKVENGKVSIVEGSEAVTLTEGKDIVFVYNAGAGEQEYEYLPIDVTDSEGISVTIKLVNPNYRFVTESAPTQLDSIKETVIVQAEGKTEVPIMGVPAAGETMTYPYNGQPQPPVSNLTRMSAGSIKNFTIHFHPWGDTEFTEAHLENQTVDQLTPEAIRAIAPTEPGSYLMIVDGVSETEYAYRSWIFTITKATVTIRPNDKSAYVGDAVPVLGENDYTVIGLVWDDTLSIKPTLAYEGTPDMSKAGTYAIKAGSAAADAAHYELVYEDGTLTVSHRSSGGGGGSSSGNTTTETEKNPDGSTTTTVTDKKTGTVTETTKFKDGSTLVVETKKDGTVTTTETAKNGVKVRTVDEPGEDVTAKVTIPKSVGEAVVTIPADVDYGMVAVDADTGEVVKLSVPTEDGMVVKLDGSADLVLVDRGRDFTDTKGHWAEDAIDFATAHELFSGTSGTTFTPDSPMTRAMLMTVLARFDGQDTTGGAVWYEKAMAWARENGISDGSNPDGSITREQLATMLWRYAGSPAGNGSAIGRFTDSGKVSSYAVEAMNWAVGTGLFGGMGDGTLAPQGSATRAQVATILMRFVENLTK